MLRDHQTMTILDIPDVVVRELINVRLEMTIGVHVHVGNKEMRTIPSVPPPFEYSWSCIVSGTLKSTSTVHQLTIFLL